LSEYSLRLDELDELETLVGENERTVDVFLESEMVCDAEVGRDVGGVSGGKRDMFLDNEERKYLARGHKFATTTTTTARMCAAAYGP